MESASRLNKGSPPIEGWLLMNPVTDGCCGNTGCHNRCVKTQNLTELFPIQLKSRESHLDGSSGENCGI